MSVQAGTGVTGLLVRATRTSAKSLVTPLSIASQKSGRSFSSSNDVSTTAEEDVPWSSIPRATLAAMVNEIKIPNRRNQRTLKEEVVLRGHGVHTDQPCEIKFTPTPANSGRFFRRRDVHRRSYAQVDFINSVRFPLRQTLRMRGPDAVPTTIYTVEHALAAVAGLGIDNVLIDVRGPEVPIFDGSLEFFTAELAEAGVKEQKGYPQPIVRVLQRVEAKIGDSTAVLEPFDEGLDITVNLDYDHPRIGEQSYQFQLCTKDDVETFKSEVARARTFGFEKDADALQARGIAMGAHPNNTLIFTENGIHDKCEGLRYDNEPARHKAADALGDLQLTGRWGNLRAKYTGDKAGHAVNTLLLRNLFASRDNFQVLPSLSLLR